MKLLEPSKYKPIATQVAAEVGSEIMQIIPDCRVEHAGSSAIPGSISKGDVDVCVIVPPHRHPGAVTALEQAGYVIKQDNLRTPELCMLLSTRTDIDLALQVVAEGSQFEFFIHFRDALRANQSLVVQYNDLKRNAAGLSHEKYRDAKSTFIKSILGLVPSADTPVPATSNVRP